MAILLDLSLIAPSHSRIAS